jgi:transposase-like protein
MTIVKIASPVSNLSDVQYKFFVSEEYEKQEKKYENRRKLSINKRVYMVDEGKYAYENPVCSRCYSRDITEYGYNSKMLIDEEGVRHDIYIQRYHCKSCGKYFQTEFTEEYMRYSNFSNKTKAKSVNTMQLDRISLRNTSKLYKNFSNIQIPHETIRKAISTSDSLYFVNNNAQFKKRPHRQITQN